MNVLVILTQAEMTQRAGIKWVLFVSVACGRNVIVDGCLVSMSALDGDIVDTYMYMQNPTDMLPNLTCFQYGLMGRALNTVKAWFACET